MLIMHTNQLLRPAQVATDPSPTGIYLSKEVASARGQIMIIHIIFLPTSIIRKLLELKL